MPANPANRIRGRVNKIRGDHAEAVVAYHLHRMGFLAIVRLETGWRVKRAGGKIIGATPMAKVTGDFRAVVPGGRSVLIEVKRRTGVLRYSHFQLHNRLAMDNHAAAGGLSMVAWVAPQGVAIFGWDIIAQGKGISWETAEASAFLAAVAVEAVRQVLTPPATERTDP